MLCWLVVFALCPWKGFSSLYLCVSFLATAAWEERMLNACLLIHLPCTSLQPEVGTAKQGFGKFVAVANLNPWHSSMGSQVFHNPTELSPYQPCSCCSPAMCGLGTWGSRWSVACWLPVQVLPNGQAMPYAGVPRICDLPLCLLSNTWLSILSWCSFLLPAGTWANKIPPFLPTVSYFSWWWRGRI